MVEKRPNLWGPQVARSNYGGDRWSLTANATIFKISKCRRFEPPGGQNKTYKVSLNVNIPRNFSVAIIQTFRYPRF